MSDPLAIALVPGYLLADDELLTPAIARAIARPTVSLTGTIGAASIAAGSINTAALQDGLLSADAVGRAKMADGYITTAKIQDGAVTYAKLDANFIGDVTTETIASGDFLIFGDITDSSNTKKVTLANALVAAGVSSFTSAEFPLAVSVVNLSAGQLTSASTTATVTHTGHGFITGQYVTIAGASPSAYNGTYLIAVTDADHFTYTFAGGTSPATGTISATSSIVLLAEVAHGLTAAPGGLRVVAKCTDAGGDAGYVQNDEVDILSVFSTVGENFIWSFGATATKVFLRSLSMVNMVICNKAIASPQRTAFMPSKWKAKFYARL